MDHLAAAAKADPLAAEPWRQSAFLHFEQWRKSRDPAAFDRFETDIANMLERAPNSSAAWAAAGEWHREAFAEVARPEWIAKSSEAFRRAVELYPNNAIHRAQWAEVLLASGDREAFQREARLALHLDDLNPHPDKKLPQALRNRLEKELDGGP